MSKTKQPNNFLIKIKSKVGKILFSDFVGNLISIYFKNNIPCYDCIVDTNSSFFTNTMRASIYFKAYEGAEIRFIRKYLPSNRDVIELGSSLGIVSSQIAKKLDFSQSRLFCIEANHELLNNLKSNIKINGGDNIKYKILNNLIDYSKPTGSTIDFYANSDILVSSKFIEKNQINDTNIQKIENLYLSELLKTNLIKDYTLICDIEGGEIDFLINDVDSLRNCKLMIIELHDTKYLGKNYSIDNLIDIINNFGFFTLIDSYGPVAVFSQINSVIE